MAGTIADALQDPSYGQQNRAAVVGGYVPPAPRKRIRDRLYDGPEGGKYSDERDYLRDVYRHARDMAVEDGLDPSSPEAQQKINEARAQAIAEMPAFVKPQTPVNKQNAISVKPDEGLWDSANQKWIVPPGRVQEKLPESTRAKDIEEGRGWEQADQMTTEAVDRAGISRESPDWSKKYHEIYQESVNVAVPSRRDAARAKKLQDGKVKQVILKDPSTGIMRLESLEPGDEIPQGFEIVGGGAGRSGGGKPLPRAIAERLSDAESAVNNLIVLKSYVDNPDVVGISGPIAGRTLGENPFSETVGKFDGARNTAKQVIGKYLEGGVLRLEDEKKYEKIIPSKTMLPAVQQSQAKTLYDALRSKLATDLESYEKAGYDIEPYKAKLEDLDSQFGVSGKGKPQSITTKEEFDALPPGSPFIFNGKQGVKKQ